MNNQRGSGRVVQAAAFQAAKNGSIPLIRSSLLPVRPPSRLYAQAERSGLSFLLGAA